MRCWQAAWSGHLATVKELLAAGAAVDAKNEVCAALHPCIHIACLPRGSVWSRSCVACGLQMGWTALSYAAYDGRSDVAAELLRHGASINVIDNVSPVVICLEPPR